jgi:hypothetical protein
VKVSRTGPNIGNVIAQNEGRIPALPWKRHRAPWERQGTDPVKTYRTRSQLLMNERGKRIKAQPDT